MSIATWRREFRVRLLISLLILLLTKLFLGLGFADRLAATGPAPLTEQTTVQTGY